MGVEVALAPIRITVKPIGTVRVTVAPVQRRIAVAPTVYPITVRPSQHSITVSPVGVQGPPGPVELFRQDTPVPSPTGVYLRFASDGSIYLGYP